jgi:uncharacterized protein YqeY
MLKERLSGLIKEAMLEKNQVKLETLRSIKTAFMNYETAKNAKPLDEAAEIQILRKMVAQREESIEQYKLAGRIESAEQEMKEIEILNSFLPAPVSKEDIEEFTKTLITPETTKRDMGNIVKTVKTKFPTAEGKLVADIVKSLIP